MSVETAPRRRRLEPDARRGQILACAVRLFGERPYAEVSTTDIAREAGVARGLVNHYFGAKKDLYLEVVRVMVTIPEVALERLPKGDLRTRVDASVTWFLDVVSRHSTSWLAAVTARGWVVTPTWSGYSLRPRRSPRTGCWSPSAWPARRSTARSYAAWSARTAGWPPRPPASGSSAAR
ncbi:TetR/AcrR family transcriptional regulator [Micromonospora sp. M12]